MVGMPNPFSMDGYNISMDGDRKVQLHGITKEERDSVQVLSNYSGQVSKEQALAVAAEYLSANYVTTHIPFYNMPKNEVRLTMESKYCYDPSKSTRTRTKKQGSDNIVTIGKDDHAYIQLIPRNFVNYDTMRKMYKFCYLKKVGVRVDQKSTTSASQQFAFYPFPQDTRKWTNQQVFSSYIGSVKEINNNLRYVCSCFAPSILRLVSDEWQDVAGTQKKFLDPRVKTNSIISLDILDQIKGTGNDSEDFFSYGTCCFTGGSGNEKTYFNVNIDMIFECINDQSILRPLPVGGDDDWEGSEDEGSDGEGDGEGDDGSGSGSGNPASRGDAAPAPEATEGASEGVAPAAPKVQKNRRKRTGKN